MNHAAVVHNVEQVLKQSIPLTSTDTIGVE